MSGGVSVDAGRWCRQAARYSVVRGSVVVGGLVAECRLVVIVHVTEVAELGYRIAGQVDRGICLAVLRAYINQPLHGVFKTVSLDVRKLMVELFYNRSVIFVKRFVVGRFHAKHGTYVQVFV